MTQTKSASAELFAQHTQDYEAIQEYLKRDDAVGRFARMYDTGYFCWLNRLLFDRDGLPDVHGIPGAIPEQVHARPVRQRADPLS